MPTLVAEMTPLQRVWLYENQLTRGDSYEEKWNRMPMKSSFDEIFRARPDMAPRKRKMETVVTANPTPTHRRHQEHHKGPMFMHHGDKLTWQQSLENLTIYRDHYGVSCQTLFIFNLNFRSSTPLTL